MIKEHKTTLVLLVAAVLILAIVFALMKPFGGSAAASSGILASNQTLQARFAALSTANSDQCSYLGNQAAIYQSIGAMTNTSYLQGSCCSPMNYTHYVEQIAGLKNYSDISAIPQDPYNVTVQQVKQMLNYYNSITLNQSQNATFDQAASLTADKSWCCCPCWAWYAHAGLAKYLIKNYNYNVTQVVNLVNLEDCCGG